MAKELSGTITPNRNGKHATEQLRKRIEAAGVYLVEFSWIERGGEKRKMLSTLVCD